MLGLAVPRAQVHVGDPQGSHPLLAGACRVNRLQAFDTAHRVASSGFSRILRGGGEVQVTGRLQNDDTAAASASR
ncbi:hypothetical protein PtoMrB4_38980 [Metapseudomonas otitidis]|uniref:Uncharacterized protein n=1 Tax=Metapseudomonas otitidis TaxID=319939 RepID=A0A679GFI2_9GAMM|nr:hypothetical protein PtoMrB4_38980 [Pseudomonas otitidis]